MTKRRHRPTKKLFGQDRSHVGRLARALTLSFYPKHLDILKQRERELGVHRSILMQLLLELELRGDLLHGELSRRLANYHTSRNLPGTTERTHDQSISHSVAQRHD